MDDFTVDPDAFPGAVYFTTLDGPEQQDFSDWMNQPWPTYDGPVIFNIIKEEWSDD